MSSERPRPDQSTRAIRAASRIAEVSRLPMAGAIHRTDTLSFTDAEERARVLPARSAAPA